MSMFKISWLIIVILSINQICNIIFINSLKKTILFCLTQTSYMIKNKTKNKQYNLSKDRENKIKDEIKNGKKVNTNGTCHDKCKAVSQKTPNKRSQSQNKDSEKKANISKTSSRLQVILESKKEGNKSPLSSKSKELTKTQRKTRASSAVNQTNRQKTIFKTNKNYNKQSIKPLPQLVKQQQAKLIKTPDHVNEVEDERLEMLKLYIKQDSQRIQRLKKIRDEHVISQISFTQNALKKKTLLFADHQQIIHCRNQLVELKQKHQEMLTKHYNEINNYKIQLINERSLKAALEKKVSMFQSTIASLKLEIQKQAQQLEQNKQRATNIINSQVPQRSSNVDKEKQEMNLKQKTADESIKSLQLKISELSAAKSLLEQKLRKSELEKQIIKKNAQQVLTIVRNQIHTAEAEKKALQL